MRMEKSTEIVLAWELHEQGLSKSAIARRLGRHRETIILWIQGIERYGLKGYVDKTQHACTQHACTQHACTQHACTQHACKVSRPKRQVDALVKRWVWSIREREEQCCRQKIAYFLEREQGVQLSVPKIYEILAEKYVLRGHKRRNQARGAVPQAEAARQVVQVHTVDTVHFGSVFAFTAVDIFSREADVLLRASVTADDGTADDGVVTMAW
jgi:transposase